MARQAALAPVAWEQRHYTYSKLPQIRTPETQKTQIFCRESVTSDGTEERNEATVAPSPRRSGGVIAGATVTNVPYEGHLT